MVGRSPAERIILVQFQSSPLVVYIFINFINFFVKLNYHVYIIIFDILNTAYGKHIRIV
jgi:hypothetical protein